MDKELVENLKLMLMENPELGGLLRMYIESIMRDRDGMLYKVMNDHVGMAFNLGCKGTCENILTELNLLNREIGYGNRKR